MCVARKKILQDYETDIKKLNDVLIDYPENETIRNKLNFQVRKWADIVQLVFYQAMNERKPYSSGEVRYPVLPMPTKKVSGHMQTSDYLCYLPQYKQITGVFWERKEYSDHYSTLIHHQERFYNECRRAQQDPDCDVLIIGVEGTQQKFLKYRPNGKAGASLQSRYALCESLSPRFGYSVIVRWHNGRQAAIDDMVNQNRMWIKYNYEKIIGLGTGNTLF